MNELNQRNVMVVAPASLTVRDVITPIFRRKRFLVGSFAGLMLVAIVATLLMSGTYKCRMEILVDRDRTDPSVSAGVTGQSPAMPLPLTEEEINSEVELLLSPDLLRQVVVANGLQDDEKSWHARLTHGKQPEEWYVASAVKHLSQQLNIGVVKKTNMIEVGYKSKDPKIAFGVLDKLSGLYMEKHLTVHRPTGSYEFFAKETDKYKHALADSEARLAGFGKAEGVVAPDVQRGDLAQVAMNSVAAFHNAQQSVAADEQRIRQDEAKMKEIPARSSTQEVSNSANLLLQQLQQTLLTAQLQRSQLLLKFDPSYPLVQEADREIAQTQSAINDAQKTQFVNQTTDRDPTYELMREDVARTQADLAAQKATATALQHSMQSIQEQMMNLDEKAVKQADLIREVKADEGNYLLYLSKREQERTSDALDQKRIGNVAIAVPPIMPMLPAYSALVIFLVGCFLAAFLSVCGVFVMEYLDSSFRTPAEVVEVLRLPVLASVPLRST
jgi:uncharacterized protein involved in exopolysaccharide biosynthesis